jgi:hypothetical protein
VKDNQRASHFKVGFENNGPAAGGHRPSSALPTAPNQMIPIPARHSNASALTNKQPTAKEINS